MGSISESWATESLDASLAVNQYFFLGENIKHISPNSPPFILSISKIVNRNKAYSKIPKISPGAYIFQRPFLRGLYLEGLTFGGAYLRREICVSKSIGLAL